MIWRAYADANANACACTYARTQRCSPARTRALLRGEAVPYGCSTTHGRTVHLLPAVEASAERWEERVDPQTGATTYVNTKTQEQTVKRPASFRQRKGDGDEDEGNAAARIPAWPDRKFVREKVKRTLSIRSTPVSKSR